MVKQTEITHAETENTGTGSLITRRSVLAGAAMCCGGAAISAAAQSAHLNIWDRAGQSAQSLAVNPIEGFSTTGITQSLGSGESAKFSTEFLSNKAFRDMALNFDPADPVRIDGNRVETGALTQTNGDIVFRIYAPGANDVRLNVDYLGDRALPLKKQSNGVFEGLLPYAENHTGPANVDVYIDGCLIIYPYLPIQWAAIRPRNYIEVPDHQLDFMLIRDVPHGTMCREIYWADSLKSWERCVVYVPAGYMKSMKDYPVLYLQHGGGDNETAWEYGGRVAHILDNLVAEGKVEPFIAVMNNDTLRYSDTPRGVIDDAFERMLIENCIPYIEKHYRVKTDKWNRSIAGLSMGSYMSCDIGFKHPELFGSMGTFTASMTAGTNIHTTYERPYPNVMRDPARFAQAYKLYFRSTTPMEDHFEYFLADDNICEQAGIDKMPGYHRVLYSKGTSKWNSWRMGIRDYAQLLFR